MPDYTLPPLKHTPVAPKGRLESWLDRYLVRAVASRRSWWWAAARWAVYVLAAYTLVLLPLLGDDIGIRQWLTWALGYAFAVAVTKPGFTRVLARLTLRLGQTFPYLLRPFYWVAKAGRRYVLPRITFETARTQFVRRLFSLDWYDGAFRPSYAVANWAALALGLYLLPIVLGDVLLATYVYTTYPFGTYHDVIVTQAYRNITAQNTYSVHGYEVRPDGSQEELYFEIATNVWFWNLYPEYMFGQVIVLGRCTFDTYGITIRVPRRLRLFAAGSIYAANPYIVSLHCSPPTVVPPK